MSSKPIKNIIKIRDDREPLVLTQEKWDSDFSFLDEHQSSS